MNALKPADIQSIELDDETNEAVVTVDEEMLSLAIGKRGQNVRLAARLTGWDVNIVGAGGVLPKSAHPASTGSLVDSVTGQATDTLSPEEQQLLAEMRSEPCGSYGPKPSVVGCGCA